MMARKTPSNSHGTDSDVGGGGGGGGKPANFYKRVNPADAIRERIEREEREAKAAAGK